MEVNSMNSWNRPTMFHHLGKMIALSILLVAFAILMPITAAAQTATDTIVLPDDNEPVAFDGGILIGGVEVEQEGEDIIQYTLRGAAGIVFPKDHPGGILILEFKETPQAPIAAQILQFPHKLEPSTLDLDGSRPLHIQIAPQQVYLFISLANNIGLDFSSITFQENVQPPALETCDCEVVMLQEMVEFEF